MRFTDCIALAVESFWNGKLRTMLAVLGVLVGITSVVILFAVTSGARAAIISELATTTGGRFNLSIRPTTVAGQASKVNSFSSHDIKALELVPGVRVVIPNQLLFLDWRIGNQSGRSEVVGTRHTTATALHYAIERGRWFSYVEEQQAIQVAVVGSDWASRTLGRLDPVGQTVILGGLPFTIVGEVREFSSFLNGIANGNYSSTRLYIPHSVSGRLVMNPAFDLLQLDATRPTERTLVSDLAIQVLSTLHPGTLYESYQMAEDLSHAQRIFQILTQVVLMVTAVTLGVAGLGVANVMLMAVKERTFEIAVRKSMGAKRRDILVQFLTEATLVALSGGVLGAILGTVLVPVFGNLMGLSIRVTATPLITAEVVAAVVGLVSGAYPAYLASALEPARALSLNQ